jgi:hypothetical protein
MKKILLLLCMILFVATGNAQQTTTQKAYYSLPDTIVVNEADIYYLLQEGNYSVLHCDYFAKNTRKNTLVLADKKDKKVVKGIAMEFSNGGMFTAATIFSKPYRLSKKRKLKFSSIRLLLIDGSLIELKKSWFVDSGYDQALQSLKTVLQITNKTTNQN